MSNQETQTPTLQGLLSTILKQHTRKIRQCLPARIESYDEATRKASVFPLLLEAYNDAGGERRVEPLPVITNVPVIFPGSRTTRLRWPIRKGDAVLLLFSSASLDRWLARGGVVDPGDERSYDLNDCVAIPGVSDFLHADDDAVMIEFTENSQIHAGGSSALATKADIDALRDHYAGHQHTSATAGAPTTDLLFAGLPSAAPNAVGTITLKGG